MIQHKLPNSRMLSLAALLLCPPLAAPAQGALARHYQPGEQVAYTMHGTNQGHTSTFDYQAHAQATVQKTASGSFTEVFTWSDFKVGGQLFPLSPESLQFHEPLSLAPDQSVTVPDLSKVQPILIGPTTDLLTFYADVQLAMRQKGLVHAGDHVFFAHGVPNSWADGTQVVLGQDAIDFDLTLQSIEPSTQNATQIKTQIATLVVRHLPPAQQKIQLAAPWMREPVGSAPNNWVEVEKNKGGYDAEVGLETFAATIRLSLPSGRILSATLENPVDVRARSCDDASLTTCGPPQTYRIVRHITIEADAASLP